MKDRLALHSWQRAWADCLVQSIGGQSTNPALTFYQQSMQNRLADSLATIYPAVANLAGTDTFDRLVESYRRSYPPRDPDLMLFGEQLGPFLRHFETSPVQQLERVARLEWFLHRCHLECCHPLLSRGHEPPLFLGSLSGHKIYLDQRPRLFRTCWATYEEVAPYHELPIFIQGNLQQRSWLGIGMISTDEEPQYWTMPPGSYVFLRQLCAGESLETSLTWGLYSDPDGQYLQVLESLHRAGLIRIA